MSGEMGRTDCPFSAQNEELVNVKFFRGTRDDVITAEELKEQARHAAVQFKIGTAAISAVAPRSAHPTMNVVDFVATL